MRDVRLLPLLGDFVFRCQRVLWPHHRRSLLLSLTHRSRSVHADLNGRQSRCTRSTKLNATLAADLNATPRRTTFFASVYYQEERWDDAIKRMRSSRADLAPTMSAYHLWLGRAYGDRRPTPSTPSKPIGLAKKVHSEFERAVQLDSDNLDALSDLGDFYVEAPGIVGGGKKKAQDVARTLQQHSPPQAYQLQGRVAEKDKNYALAEQDYKAAIEASQQAPDAWLTLASFYARRHQRDQMLAAIHAAIDADSKSAKPHGPALVEAALLLSRNQQDPQLAIELLRRYLASENKSADSPAFRVHTELGRLLEQQGDHAGAQQEIAAAAALARDYHPPATSR